MLITPPEFIANFLKQEFVSFLKIQFGYLGPHDFRTSATGVTMTASKLRRSVALFSFLRPALLRNGETG